MTPESPPTRTVLLPGVVEEHRGNVRNNGVQPALSLDDLATDWLSRRMSGLAAMPGLNNDIGAVQMEADPAAIKHMIFPPYSAGNETTWTTLLNGRHIALQTSHVEIRWRAYQVERRCTAGDFRFESVTSLLPNQPGCVVRLTVTNTSAEDRPLRLGFLCSGRAVNEGTDGYAWGVPTVPTDVFSFCKDAGLRQFTAPVDAMPGAISIANENGSAHAVHAFSPAPHRWENERSPAWEVMLPAGGSFTVTLLGTFHEEASTALALASQWHGREEAAMAAMKAQWENLWQSAFTPDNAIFSGHLPILQSPHDAMLRLYYNGILTLLTCRRVYPSAMVKPAYLTLWPRRGEGSNYLAWELNCTGGILARLDPAALRSHWLLLASAPWLDYQVTNFFTGKHGGWRCVAQPQSVIMGALNLQRWHGDDSWQREVIVRQPRTTAGFEAASQNQVVGENAGAEEETTGRAVFEQAVLVHRTHHLPGKAVVDFGGRSAYLECISTYAHGAAGLTAFQAWALENAAPILGKPSDDELVSLLAGVRDLYDDQREFFSCEYPDGSRHPAPNLYDLALVLRYAGAAMPRPMREGITKFIREELLTPTWSHCLWPSDADSLSTNRCDHQWLGCFSAWIPLSVLGFLNAETEGDWLIKWLEGVAHVTRQGPFAQAYWTEDVYPPESGAAAKCFDEHTQCNHWVIGSGTLFAEMVLDGICGLQADLNGNLTVRAGLEPWAKSCTLTNIRVRGRDYDLQNGRLISREPTMKVSP